MMADDSGFVPQKRQVETAFKAAATLPNGAPPSISAPFGYKSPVTSQAGADAFPASNGMHNLHHNQAGSLSSQSSRDSSPASRYNHESMANHSGGARPPFQGPGKFQQHAPFGLTRPPSVVGQPPSWHNSSAAPTSALRPGPAAGASIAGPPSAATTPGGPSLSSGPPSGLSRGRPSVPFSGPPANLSMGPSSSSSFSGLSAGPRPSGQATGPPPLGLSPRPPSSGQATGPPLSGLPSGPPPSGLLSGPPPSGLPSGPPPSGLPSGPPPSGLPSGPPPSGLPSGLPPSGFSSGPPPLGPLSGPPAGGAPGSGMRPSTASFPRSCVAPPSGPIPGFPGGPPSNSTSSANSGLITSPSAGPALGPYNMGSSVPTVARPGPLPGPPSGVFHPPPGQVPATSQADPPSSGYQYSEAQAPRQSTAPSYHAPSRQAAAYPEVQQNQYGPGSGDQQRRYPPPQPYGPDGLVQQMGQLNVAQMGYNKLWGYECHDLLQNRNILPAERIRPPSIRLVNFSQAANCNPDIFRCTVTKIPETKSLLQKSRLPLGVLIYPFKDLECLPLVQSDVIVRCRSCRTYINPFVYFTDDTRWKCNLCFRTNELPAEFLVDPVRKVYSDPSKRPEVNSSTIEFIAPSEYMLRPPQPAVYLFLLDVSRFAVETGYLHQVCGILLDSLKELPGDSRTAVGFITYDSSVHFYSLAEGMSTPQQMVVMDIDDVFLPCPHNLLANLREHMGLVQELLAMLPKKFQHSYDTGSALGAALQAAYKLMAPTGGRISVFQCCLPNKGPGALTPREDPSNRASSDVAHLNPATDFYKRLALDFSSQQTAVDLFVLNQQYCDLATLCGVSKFSGGCIYHFPLYQSNNVLVSDSFECALNRYLKRKIGFEAVMRIRCTRGLSIHTFHGNFFVRTTDLLALPNVNPDSGFGMQVMIDENLTDLQTVSFQSAVLYTSSRGERRIRVHTLCLPVCSNLSDVLHSADQQCIVGLLSKMAVDRSLQSSISDARDAFINVAIDVLSAFKLTQSSGSSTALLVPNSLKLLPLYILALLKSEAFRTGTSTRLDDRVFSMCQMKALPLDSLMQNIYPDLYPVHCINQYELEAVDELVVPLLPRLHLSAEKLDGQGAFLMDTGDCMMLLVGRAISVTFCENVLGVSSFAAIPDNMYDLPELGTDESKLVRNFIMLLQMEKPYNATLHVIREDSKHRLKFMERLIEDRTESSLSYYEFLQHLKSQVK